MSFNVPKWKLNPDGGQAVSTDELTEGMPLNSYLRNCFIFNRPGDRTPFTALLNIPPDVVDLAKRQGVVFASLDGYAIVPREVYEALETTRMASRLETIAAVVAWLTWTPLAFETPNQYAAYLRDHPEVLDQPTAQEEPK